MLMRAAAVLCFIFGFAGMIYVLAKETIDMKDSDSVKVKDGNLTKEVTMHELNQ